MRWKTLALSALVVTTLMALPVAPAAQPGEVFCSDVLAKFDSDSLEMVAVASAAQSASSSGPDPEGVSKLMEVRERWRIQVQTECVASWAGEILPAGGQKCVGTPLDFGVIIVWCAKYCGFGLRANYLVSVSAKDPNLDEGPIVEGNSNCAGLYQSLNYNGPPVGVYCVNFGHCTGDLPGVRFPWGSCWYMAIGPDPTFTNKYCSH